MWQLPDGDGELLPLRTVAPLHGASRSVVFVPHGQLLVTASEEDHVVSVNPLAMLTGQWSRHLEGRCLNVDLARDLAVTADAGGAITLGGLRRSDVRTKITTHTSRVLAVALSPRGHTGQRRRGAGCLLAQRRERRAAASPSGLRRAHSLPRILSRRRLRGRRR